MAFTTMKLVTILIVSIISKHWGSAQTEKKYDSIVIGQPITASNLGTALVNFHKCDRELRTEALRYVQDYRALTILLRAAEFKYEGKSLQECTHLLNNLLPAYLRDIKKMLACVDYKFIPITKYAFEEFVKTLQTILTNGMSTVDDPDVAITMLKKIAEETMDTPEAFIAAFYEISLQFVSKVDIILLQDLRNSGIDPSIHFYNFKTLLQVTLDKIEAVRDEEITIRANYLFRCTMEYFQRIATPSWVQRLQSQSKLTESSIWELIIYQTDCVPLKVLIERVRKCSLETVRPEDILDFILSKRKEYSAMIHTKKIDFPAQLSESQWNEVFQSMNLRSPQEKCLVRSIAIPIQLCETALIIRTEGERMTEKSEKLYVYLKNVGPSYTESELKKFFDDRFTEMLDQKLTIVAVIRLQFIDVRSSFEVLLQFNDENAAFIANGVLQLHKVKLPKGETVEACPLEERLDSRFKST